jgi:hypothetical protein
MSYNITDKILIGLDGKYIYTDEADVHESTVKFNLNGLIVTGVFGFRF